MADTPILNLRHECKFSMSLLMENNNRESRVTQVSAWVIYFGTPAPTVSVVVEGGERGVYGDCDGSHGGHGVHEGLLVP